MSPLPDTIFALSSGRLPAAIAVVRISGPRAGDALKALAGRIPEPRKAAFARVRDPATREPIDDALALWFPGPNSETGEDTAELQLHGGRAVLAATLAALGKIEGCRPAEAGEFTRRAFENGKIDLTTVEGLADLVAAETEGQRRQALRQMQGALRNRAEGWREKLVKALALTEAGIDFSDEGDVPEDLRAPAVAIARELEAEIAGVLRDAARGERLREGMVVAIAGPPNAGKSTLLNRLAQREVAIVSPHAGTTRDVIEVHLDLDGWPVTLLDTAGIRETDDPVEMEGVRRARERAAAADLVLWVVDAAQPLAEQAEGLALGDRAEGAGGAAERNVTAPAEEGGPSGSGRQPTTGAARGHDGVSAEAPAAPAGAGASVKSESVDARTARGAPPQHGTGSVAAARANAPQGGTEKPRAAPVWLIGNKADLLPAAGRALTGAAPSPGRASSGHGSADRPPPAGLVPETGHASSELGPSPDHASSELGPPPGHASADFGSADLRPKAGRAPTGLVPEVGQASPELGPSPGYASSDFASADLRPKAGRASADLSPETRHAPTALRPETGQASTALPAANPADLAADIVVSADQSVPVQSSAAQSLPARSLAARSLAGPTASAADAFLAIHEVGGSHSFLSDKNDSIHLPFDIRFILSSVTGKGVDRLLAALAGLAARTLGAAEPALVSRQRQRAALDEVRIALGRASTGPMADDLLAEDLRLAARALSRLTGRVDVEDILDVIFRDFCIGK